MRKIRHTYRISNKDEEVLTPKQQQRRIDKDIPFNVLVNEQIDRDILLGNLPHQDRKIFEVMSDGNTQKEAAEELGVRFAHSEKAGNPRFCITKVI